MNKRVICSIMALIMLIIQVSGLSKSDRASAWQSVDNRHTIKAEYDKKKDGIIAATFSVEGVEKGKYQFNISVKGGMSINWKGASTKSLKMPKEQAKAKIALVPDGDLQPQSEWSIQVSAKREGYPPVIYEEVFRMIEDEHDAQNSYGDNSDSKSYREDLPVVVSMGDSYAAGEGCPPFYGFDDQVSPADLVYNADWLSHRSKNAWSGQLVFYDKNGEPVRISDYKDANWFFTAVSGATTYDITDGKQKKKYSLNDNLGNKGTAWIPKQLDVFQNIKANNNNRKVDYVTLSIGGNDLGFADTLTNALLESVGAHVLTLNATVDRSFSAALLSAIFNDAPVLKKEILNTIREFDKQIKDDEMNDREKLRKTYVSIAQAAGPQAKILVTGYPTLLDKDIERITLPEIKNLIGNPQADVSDQEAILICNSLGNVLFTESAAETISSAVDFINSSIEDIIRELRSEGINIYYVPISFKGHEAYTDDPWINPVIFKSMKDDLEINKIPSVYSIHPNAKGVAQYARSVQYWVDILEEDAQVTGNVYIADELGRQTDPEEVEIVFTDSYGEKKYTVVTDEEGKYSIKLPRDEYTVELKRPARDTVYSLNTSETFKGRSYADWINTGNDSYMRYDDVQDRLGLRINCSEKSTQDFYVFALDEEEQNIDLVDLDSIDFDQPVSNDTEADNGIYAPDSLNAFSIDGLLALYIQAIQECYDDEFYVDLPEEKGISICIWHDVEFAKLEGKDPYDMLGYCVYGTQEEQILLIGNTNDMDGEVYDAYVIRNGAPKLILQSAERSVYLWDGTHGTVCNVGSSGWDASVDDEYYIDDDYNLVLVSEDDPKLCYPEEISYTPFSLWKNEPEYQPDDPIVSNGASDNLLPVLEHAAPGRIIRAFGQADYDGDGTYEAFGLALEYEDDIGSPAELWFVKDSRAIRCETEGCYYETASCIDEKNNETLYKVIEGYGGSGELIRYWGCESGVPYLYHGEYGMVAYNVFEDEAWIETGVVVEGQETPITIQGDTDIRNDDLSVGDIVALGHYPQTSSNTDATPIEWQVLDIQNNKALLLSRYGLDTKPYNNEYVDITWENCSLRKWLNDDFVNSAFSAEEQKVIMSTHVDNSQSQGNDGWSTVGGNETDDKLFLLSHHEAFDLYFRSEEEGKCALTDYAISQGALTFKDDRVDGKLTGIWWLRSPGVHQDLGDLVYLGGPRSIGRPVNDSNCSVRPALWLDLNSGSVLIRNQALNQDARNNGYHSVMPKISISPAMYQNDICHVRPGDLAIYWHADGWISHYQFTITDNSGKLIASQDYTEEKINVPIPYVDSLQKLKITVDVVPKDDSAESASVSMAVWVEPDIVKKKTAAANSKTEIEKTSKVDNEALGAYIDSVKKMIDGTRNMQNFFTTGTVGMYRETDGEIVKTDEVNKVDVKEMTSGTKKLLSALATGKFFEQVDLAIIQGMYFADLFMRSLAKENAENIIDISVVEDLLDYNEVPDEVKEYVITWLKNSEITENGEEMSWDKEWLQNGLKSLKKAAQKQGASKKVQKGIDLVIKSLGEQEKTVDLLKLYQSVDDDSIDRVVKELEATGYKPLAKAAFFLNAMKIPGGRWAFITLITKGAKLAQEKGNDSIGMTVANSTGKRAFMMIENAGPSGASTITGTAAAGSALMGVSVGIVVGFTVNNIAINVDGISAAWQKVRWSSDAADKMYERLTDVAGEFYENPQSYEQREALRLSSYVYTELIANTYSEYANVHKEMDKGWFAKAKNWFTGSDGYSAGAGQSSTIAGIIRTYDDILDEKVFMKSVKN